MRDARDRFSDIPPSLDIQVGGGEAGEAVEISLEDLPDESSELCTLLENERAETRTWMLVALAYTRQHRPDLAIDILHRGLNALARGPPRDRLAPLSLLSWLLLRKSRHAPRVLAEGQSPAEIKTKEVWLQAASSVLNDANRIDPTFLPSQLARGVLHLLRAALHRPGPHKATSGLVDPSERAETFRQARKCFEDVVKDSDDRNIMATLGLARATFCLGNYAEALTHYQSVLTRVPDMLDPDPRIGIGCCLWQLGYKEEARAAWERTLELNSSSKVAIILLGLCYLDQSAQYSSKDPAFAPIYKKAMTEYTQRAFKMDKEFPLTCTTFASYFALRQAWSTVETLARKAIENTDVNAVASDGWYLLARREHCQESPDFKKTNDYYGRADAARGGGDRGFLPARFGMAQALITQGDLDGAKFNLEKIIQATKNVESMLLLGALYAEEAFRSSAKEVKTKAIALLESVRLAWKDPSKKATPDVSVLIYLARLYEVDRPDRASQCLQQVERISIDDALEGVTDVDETRIEQIRENLSPQLLNNLGCFQFQSEKFEHARDLFQIALNACVHYGEKDSNLDTDALVTTISYNLARTYEAAHMLAEAQEVYEGLLARHDDYTDARIRAAFLQLRRHPTTEGPRAVVNLSTTGGGNLEVRALMGWYLNRSKKRVSNIAEDVEQKHYKRTLIEFDKHDRYSLVGMGNLYAGYAREMRRSTDKEKEKRSSEYLRAVGYYDKVLQLDPCNAYAALGIAIILIEDKRDLTSAVQVFSKVKDTLRDSSVYINLGHLFCELKQYTRSIESYEHALQRDRNSDPQVLACLGKTYLLKGKQDKSVAAIKSSLQYSRRALELAPAQIHFRFNVAFVQIQLAQLLYTLSESQRTLLEVESASTGLEEAIETLVEIANSPNPPYPKNDLEQRANMGKNTMRRQLERAVQSQREYEAKNSARLEEARKLREAELKRREEETRIAEEAAAEHRRKVQEERHKMLELSREVAETRAEEERRRAEAEMTTDSETGEQVRRKKKVRSKRKQKTASESESDDSSSSGDEKSDKRKKRRI